MCILYIHTYTIYMYIKRIFYDTIQKNGIKEREQERERKTKSQFVSLDNIQFFARRMIFFVFVFLVFVWFVA